MTGRRAVIASHATLCRWWKGHKNLKTHASSEVFQSIQSQEAWGAAPTDGSIDLRFIYQIGTDTSDSSWILLRLTRSLCVCRSCACRRQVIPPISRGGFSSSHLAAAEKANDLPTGQVLLTLDRASEDSKTLLWFYVLPDDVMCWICMNIYMCCTMLRKNKANLSSDTLGLKLWDHKNPYAYESFFDRTTTFFANLVLQ